MLRIHIASLTEQGLILDERADAALLPLLSAVASDGSVSFIQPIHVYIHATPAGETILVDGTVESGIRILCGRCLEPFEMKIDTDFSFTAVPEIPSMIDPAAEDDLELTADDMDVIAYHGDSIDLNDEIAQQIIMALPFKPLCKDACKGLCSRCGVDLNNASCQCHSRDESSPFAVLKTHNFPKKQE